MNPTNFIIAPGLPPVSVEQIENSIKMDQAKVELLTQRHAAWLEFGKAERELMTAIAWPGDATDTGVGIRRIYREASKSWYDAQAQLYEVEIAEAKSRVAIQQALLEEAQKKVMVAPPGDYN